VEIKDMRPQSDSTSRKVDTLSLLLDIHQD
jgi:hypothetical protein